MSFSRDSRYRNVTSVGEYPRGGNPRPIRLIAIAVAVVLLLCCCCAGLGIGLYFSGGLDQVTAVLPGAKPTVTPTPNKNAPVALKKPGVADNGLEVTVTGFQRPLKVEGTVKLPADQQFVLATVRIRNTKTTGASLKVTAADFKAKGDGGLTYDANPKTVTITNMLGDLDLGPGKSQEVELIFQIATDDTGLKLNWNVGGATRVFILE
jgi:hypothetical protein